MILIPNDIPFSFAAVFGTSTGTEPFLSVALTVVHEPEDKTRHTIEQYHPMKHHATEHQRWST